MGHAHSSAHSESHNTSGSYNTTTTTIDNSVTSGIRDASFGNISGGIHFGRSAAPCPPRHPAPPQSASTITVANASAYAVKLYCSPAKMSTSCLIQGNGYLLTPPGVFCIDILPTKHVSQPIADDVYVTVFKVTGQSYCPDGRPLLENYLVEKHSAKSCIIAEVGVRLAKEGEIWTDENGTNYLPGCGH